MSSTHVVVGAGAIGSATALQLARSGERVVVVTRRGSGPIAPEIALVAADASHAPAMADVAAGATAIYNCANPRYTRWAEDWPPIAAALLYAAERSGARLVTISNLYMYEPPLRPLVEGDPTTALTRKGQVRARMWEEALAAFDAGRAEVTEARASDFVGPGLTDQAHLGERVVPRVLAGKSVSVVGNPDMPHTWSYVPDVASTLVALGTSSLAPGRVWHVPSLPARSMRQMIEAFADCVSRPVPRIWRIPAFAIKAAGLVSPELAEIPEVLYQFERPFVMESAAAQAAFGIQPTPFDEVVASTVEWWTERVGSATPREAVAIPMS
ncbi:MAG: NAD-dependent epimerase/dehydratase family protein [Acidimicrobiales bacterium]|jgi:nucleoside-diphosphate-sugar epimerase